MAKYKITTTGKFGKNIRYFRQEKYAKRWKNLMKAQADINEQKVKVKLEKIK